MGEGLLPLYCLIGEQLYKIEKSPYRHNPYNLNFCSGNLIFLQNESGRVGLEGAVCDDYYKIRDLLYEQYAIV